MLAPALSQQCPDLLRLKKTTMGDGGALVIATRFSFDTVNSTREKKGGRSCFVLKPQLAGIDDWLFLVSLKTFFFVCLTIE